MNTLTGIPVSPGIAFGAAFIRYKQKIKVSKKKIKKSETKKEWLRFIKVVKAEVKDLQGIIDNFTDNHEERDLLSSHKMILQDPLLLEKIKLYIENECYSAEYALKLFLAEITETFNKMSNEYLAERVSDYEDILGRLINSLNGNKSSLFDELDSYDENQPVIMVLDNISPSEVAKAYYQSNVNGICLAKGSKTSHSAIIARALGLPAIVGLENILHELDNGQEIIIDGSKGKVLVEPDEKTVKQYQKMFDEEQTDIKELEKLVDVPSQTADGKNIQLLCNIELEQEVDSIMEKKADGIGLFRTEYLFVDRDSLPSEEEQYNIYHRIAQKLGEKTLIIRTYDLGGDKLAETMQTEPENNPFLGLRGIRLSLKFPEVFKTQIKAIMRANKNNNISVMFPMVTSVNDIKQSLKLVEECKQELKKRNIDHNPHIKIGAMIEVPAAVFCIPELATMCDFFSVGTNDLVQYTLAADRNNKAVSQYYDSYHPAVIKLILITVINAHRHGKPVSICGELAAEKEYVALLVGLGIDSLSVNPGSLLRVKKQVSLCKYRKAKELIAKVIKTASSEEVKNIMSTNNIHYYCS